MAKFLLADDHALFREGLRLVLEEVAKDAVTVVEACSFDEAMAALQRHPDIGLALLDLHMPGMDGAAGVQPLRRAYPQVPVIMLTASEDAKHCRRALDSGAAGYVTKSSSTEVMLQAIRTVLGGGTFVCPQVATDVADEAGGLRDAETARKLTPRQLAVLAMLREGKSNKEIAEQLNIAEITVKMHVTSVFRVLGVRNRTQAALVAERRGL